MAVLLAGLLTLTAAAIDVEPHGEPVAAPSAEAAPEPTVEPEAAPEPPASPYEYLYAVHPLALARRLDCVISHESHWTPSAVNPRSGASGLAQFLRSTWATTPQGRAGLSVFDPIANIDGAAWLAEHVGFRQWTVVQIGLC